MSEGSEGWMQPDNCSGPPASPGIAAIWTRSSQDIKNKKSFRVELCSICKRFGSLNSMAMCSGRGCEHRAHWSCVRSFNKTGNHGPIKYECPTCCNSKGKIYRDRGPHSLEEWFLRVHDVFDLSKLPLLSSVEDLFSAGMSLGLTSAHEVMGELEERISLAKLWSDRARTLLWPCSRGRRACLPTIEDLEAHVRDSMAVGVALPLKGQLLMQINKGKVIVMKSRELLSCSPSLNELQAAVEDMEVK
jgi:hypothetical protein